MNYFVTFWVSSMHFSIQIQQYFDQRPPASCRCRCGVRARNSYSGRHGTISSVQSTLQTRHYFIDAKHLADTALFHRPPASYRMCYCGTISSDPTRFFLQSSTILSAWHCSITCMFRTAGDSVNGFCIYPSVAVIRIYKWHSVFSP